MNCIDIKGHTNVSYPGRDLSIIIWKQRLKRLVFGKAKVQWRGQGLYIIDLLALAQLAPMIQNKCLHKEKGVLHSLPNHFYIGGGRTIFVKSIAMHFYYVQQVCPLTQNHSSYLNILKYSTIYISFSKLFSFTYCQFP